MSSWNIEQVVRDRERLQKRILELEENPNRYKKALGISKSNREALRVIAISETQRALIKELVTALKDCNIDWETWADDEFKRLIYRAEQASHD
jgi:hypothetical protein